MEVFESLVPVGIVLLCLAGVVALVALAYVMVSLKKTIDETMSKVNPLLDGAQEALDRVQPALDRIDPLMERITLTVDAANLEIMRVDQILEDVNTITGNVSKATESLDTVTSLPFEALSNVTGRIRERIAPLNRNEGTPVDTAVSAVDQALNCVETKAAAAQVRNDVKRAEAQEAAAVRDAAQNQANDISSHIKDAVSVHTAQDTDTVRD